MDWGAIGVGIVGIAFGIFQGLRSLASDQRKQREENEKQRLELQRQLRRCFHWGDAVDGWVAEQRMRLRRHNIDKHSDSEGRLLVSELPPEIEMGIRAYVEDDE